MHDQAARAATADGEQPAAADNEPAAAADDDDVDAVPTAEDPRHAKKAGPKKPKAPPMPKGAAKLELVTQFVTELVTYTGMPDAAGQAVRLALVSSDNQAELEKEQTSLYAVLCFLTGTNTPSPGGKHGFTAAMRRVVPAKGWKGLDGYLRAVLLQVSSDTADIKRAIEAIRPILDANRLKEYDAHTATVTAPVQRMLATLVKNCVYAVPTVDEAVGGGAAAAAEEKDDDADAAAAAAADDEDEDCAEAAFGGATAGAAAARAAPGPSQGQLATNLLHAHHAGAFFEELVPETFPKRGVSRETAQIVIEELRGSARRRFMQYPAPDETVAVAARAFSFLELVANKPGLLKKLKKEEGKKLAQAAADAAVDVTGDAAVA